MPPTTSVSRLPDFGRAPHQLVLEGLPASPIQTCMRMCPIWLTNAQNSPSPRAQCGRPASPEPPSTRRCRRPPRRGPRSIANRAARRVRSTPRRRRTSERRRATDRPKTQAIAHDIAHGYATNDKVSSAPVGPTSARRWPKSTSLANEGVRSWPTSLVRSWPTKCSANLSVGRTGATHTRYSQTRPTWVCNLGRISAARATYQH